MAKVEINKEKCKGCEYCVVVCPKGVLAIDEEINTRGIKTAFVVDQNACSGCTLCAIMCPEACINIWK